LGTPGASVAVGVQKMKEAALAIVKDTNGITPGDCSAITSEISGYFDRAASAVG
jgi:phycocyanin beta chain